MISFRDDIDRARAEQIAELVNLVYAESERGLWLDGAQRTDAEEIASFAEAGELAVAELDGRIAGAVRVRQLDSATGEFGLLAADPAVRGSARSNRSTPGWPRSSPARPTTASTSSAGNGRSRGARPAVGHR